MHHTVTLPIRWGDMDSYGHLNNVNYFRLLEEVRIQWLQEIGFPVDRQEASNGPVVISVGCEFLKPVVYPASVEIHTTVEKIGRSSIDIVHELYIVTDSNAGEAPLCGRGKVRIVWIDFATEQSTPLPDELRSRLQNYC